MNEANGLGLREGHCSLVFTWYYIGDNNTNIYQETFQVSFSPKSGPAQRLNRKSICHFYL